MKKQLLSLALTLTMVISLFSGLTITASAESESTVESPVDWIVTESPEAPESYTGDGDSTLSGTCDSMTAFWLMTYFSDKIGNFVEYRGDKGDQEGPPPAPTQYLHVRLTGDNVATYPDSNSGFHNANLAGIVIHLEGHNLTFGGGGRFQPSCGVTIYGGMTSDGKRGSVTMAQELICSNYEHTDGLEVPLAVKFLGMESINFEYGGKINLRDRGANGSVFVNTTVVLEADSFVMGSGQSEYAIEAHDVTIKSNSDDKNATMTQERSSLLVAWPGGYNEGKPAPTVTFKNVVGTFLATGYGLFRCTPDAKITVINKVSPVSVKLGQDEEYFDQYMGTTEGNTTTIQITDDTSCGYFSIGEPTAESGPLLDIKLECYNKDSYSYYLLNGDGTPVTYSERYSWYFSTDETYGMQTVEQFNAGLVANWDWYVANRTLDDLMYKDYREAYRNYSTGNLELHLNLAARYEVVVYKYDHMKNQIVGALCIDMSTGGSKLNSYGVNINLSKLIHPDSCTPSYYMHPASAFTFDPNGLLNFTGMYGSMRVWAHGTDEGRMCIVGSEQCTHTLTAETPMYLYISASLSEDYELSTNAPTVNLTGEAAPYATVYMSRYDEYNYDSVTLIIQFGTKGDLDSILPEPAPAVDPLLTGLTAEPDGARYKLKQNGAVLDTDNYDWFYLKLTDNVLSQGAIDANNQTLVTRWPDISDVYVRDTLEENWGVISSNSTTADIYPCTILLLKVPKGEENPVQGAYLALNNTPVTPPHEHSYNYTSKNDGTHDATCGNNTGVCGTPTITGETCDTAGEGGACSKCGYKASEEEPGGETPAAHSHCVCGVANCDNEKHYRIECTAWRERSFLPDSAGHYYLTKDVVLNTPWNPDDGTFLCLNGHVVDQSGNGAVIYWETAATLTVTDCDKETTHTFNVNDNGLWTLAEGNSGTKTVTGGVITGGNNSGVSLCGGTFNLYGGNIVGNEANSGGGINCTSDANIYGGTICGNVAKGIGGGIATLYGSANLYGGVITENTSLWAGGGVVGIGNVYVQGTPVIDDNWVKDENSNNVENNVELVALEVGELEEGEGNLPVINIAGELTEGAKIGVTITTNDFFTSGWGNKMPADADHTRYFFSDNTAYIVEKAQTPQSTYELRLGEPKEAVWVFGEAGIDPDYTGAATGTLKKAFDAANDTDNSGKGVIYIQLLDNVTSNIQTAYTLDGSGVDEMVIDLNDKKLTIVSEDGGIAARDYDIGIKLTIRNGSLDITAKGSSAISNYNRDLVLSEIDSLYIDGSQSTDNSFEAIVANGGGNLIISGNANSTMTIKVNAGEYSRALSVGGRGSMKISNISAMEIVSGNFGMSAGSGGIEFNNTFGTITADRCVFAGFDEGGNVTVIGDDVVVKYGADAESAEEAELANNIVAVTGSEKYFAITVPHQHTYTDSYISNNDGTHKGVCACEAVSDSSEDCDTAGEGSACSKCGYTAPSDEPVTPPHEHNYTDSYVSDNGGNHKGVCACDAVSGTSEPCDTANNGACSKCGYTAPGEEPEEETFSVTITVKEEISSGTYGPCVNADVLLIGANGEELMYGTHIEDGKYVFTNVPSGIYNIEVSKNMGEPGVKVKTVLITVDSNIVLDEEIKLSQANINSKLDVTVETTDNSPIKGANVGGLDNLADMVAAQVKAEPANSGATVDIDVAMKIDTKMSENVPVEEKAPIETAAREQSSNLAFLDINITKTITVNSVARNPERIHDTGSLLEVVIPFDTDGKENFAVYRYHTESGGFTDRVQMLTSTPNRAGEYIDTRTSGIIKMYVQYFSTYAIGFDNVTSGGGIVGGSGGSDSSAYTITIAKTENGEVTVSSKSPVAGSKVTVTAKPKAGYELDQLTVTDKNGKEIKVTDLGNGTYSFKMPSGNVEVKAAFHVKFGTCPKDATCPIHPYTDASTTAWYHDGVHYCINHGIMNGYGNGIFKPNGTVTRQQIWLTLARISGENPANAAEARVWAMENGVSDGTNPTQAVTRQQFITMLYRYAVSEGYDVSVGEDTNILSYTDAFDVAEYAIPAVQWSCGSGVMGGYTDGTLKPTATTTRAHLAAFLQRFCETVAK